MSHKLTYEGEAGGDAGVGEGDGRLQNALALAQHVVEEGLKHTNTHRRVVQGSFICVFFFNT